MGVKGGHPPPLLLRWTAILLLPWGGGGGVRHEPPSKTTGDTVEAQGSCLVPRPETPLGYITNKWLVVITENVSDLRPEWLERDI